MQTNTRVQEHPQQQTAATRHGLLSPLVIALGTVLVLQLVAALALGLGGRTMEPAGSQGPLVVFDPDQVTGIRIQASESEPVLVTRTETGWIIPSLQDLPAAEHKVTGLLSKLEGLETGLREQVVQAATRFQHVLSDNARALFAVREANDRLFKAVVRAVEDKRNEARGYAAGGSFAPLAGAVAAEPVSLSVDQRL